MLTITVSITAHLLRGEPLFSSAIIQSGLLPLCGIMSEHEYQVIYNKMLQELKIPATLSPQERLARLLAASEDDLNTAMVPVFMAPVITMALCDDGVLLPGKMPSWSDFGTVKIPDWCPQVMVGDAVNECIIWNKAFRHYDGASITQLAESYPQSADLKAILQLYGIDAMSSKVETLMKAEKLCTDAM